MFSFSSTYNTVTAAKETKPAPLQTWITRTTTGHHCHAMFSPSAVKAALHVSYVSTCLVFSSISTALSICHHLNSQCNAIIVIVITVTLTQSPKKVACLHWPDDDQYDHDDWMTLYEGFTLVLVETLCNAAALHRTVCHTEPRPPVTATIKDTCLAESMLPLAHTAARRVSTYQQYFIVGHKAENIRPGCNTVVTTAHP